MKLILGTAEFHPLGYMGMPIVPIQEIRKIISCAKEGGINMIDTAEAYSCHDVIRKEAKGFCIYTKTRDWKVNLDWGENELRGILYHYSQEEEPVELPFIHRWVNLGVSVYTPYQLPENKARILQIPFNIENTTFINCFEDYRTIYVRSVFGRGKLIEKYGIQDCLKFVEGFRPDGIIVGVQTTKELEEILKST